MSNIHPSPCFQNAANYLSSASFLAQVSTSTKLELYGLFKYVTSSRMPLTSRPSIFDMTGRAKWDAWAAAGKKYESASLAEQKYLDLARSLGWTESAVTLSKDQKEDIAVHDEGIWDSSDGSSGSRSHGGVGGMGVSVSSMAPPPPEENDSSIHGLILSNDINELKAFLNKHPDSDLNVLDEFGYAPLHLACDRGNVEAVKLLLKLGADRTIKDPDNLTPLQLSQEAGHLEIEMLLVTTL